MGLLCMVIWDMTEEELKELNNEIKLERNREHLQDYESELRDRKKSMEW